MIVALAVAGFVFFPNLGSGPQQSAPRAALSGRPAPVVTALAASRPFDVELRVIGTVQAYSTVAVKSRVDGQVMAAHFQDGQFVKKGDRLFSIDPRGYEALLRQVTANLARDRAQLTRAKEDFDRQTDLMRKEFSSRQKFEEAKANAAALEATVRAGEAAVEMARLQLEYTSILSPIEGRTGSVLIDVGNLVKANDSNAMVVINQTRPIYVTFHVAEKHLPEIRRRMAEGELVVSAAIPAEPDKPERGRVTFLNNAVDQATGTIQLKATFENGNDRLVPGQFVNATLVMSRLPQAIVVPSQAVQNSQDGPYVFVVKPDLTVEQRMIVVGPASDDVTVVSQGLNAGERVVTEGQLRVISGAKVEIRADALPPGQAPKGHAGS
jgi:multidrug efflux system membrane fusion protein